MKILVKHSRKFGGKLFSKSPMPQELPDELQQDWFFKACLNAGDVSLCAAPKAEEKSEDKVEAKAEAPSKAEKKAAK